jgi:hypothetical protein
MGPFDALRSKGPRLLPYLLKSPQDQSGADIAAKKMIFATCLRLPGKTKTLVLQRQCFDKA